MKKVLVLIAFLAFVAIGCRISKPVVPIYYVLEYPSGKAEFLPDTLIPFSFSLEILPVEVFPAFATHRIAIREDSHELRYFSHHEWAVRPGVALTHFVSDFLSRNRIFERVATHFWDIEPDLRLRTTIYHLEVLQERGRYFARIYVDFMLEDTRRKILLTGHKADLRMELPKRNLNLFANEVSLIFYDELRLFVEKTIPILLNHPDSSGRHD